MKLEVGKRYVMANGEVTGNRIVFFLTMVPS